MKYAFTGMLPGAAAKFEELYASLEASGLHPRVTGGYASHEGDEDLRTYGVVCDMQCDDRDALEAQAAVLGITVQENGSLAYTNGLTIADFRTNRVNGNLELILQEEEL